MSCIFRIGWTNWVTLTLSKCPLPPSPFWGKCTFTVVLSHPSYLGTQKGSSSPDFSTKSSKAMNSLKQCPSHVIMRKELPLINGA